MAAVALAITGVAWLGIAVRGPAPDPGPPVTADRGPGATVGPVQWFGAADARHLYRTYLSCMAPCAKDSFLVEGSDDGGRTWTVRAPKIPLGRLEVVDADRLISQPAVAPAPLVSVHGGRTWTAATPGAPPAGSPVICWTPAQEGPCAPYAVDPATGVFGPLPARPDVLATHVGTVEVADGRMWLGGAEPGTGRPAIALSTDGGATWSRHVFTDIAPCHTVPECQTPEVAAGAGAAYATVGTPSAERRVYAWTPSTGWQRVDAADGLPGGKDDYRWSYVAADGTHVVCTTAPRSRPVLDSCVFHRPGADGAYRVVEPEGLPGTVYPVLRTADGWFYTHSYDDDRLYGSADGLRWTALPH